MILLLVPVLCAVVGLAVYVGLRYTGAFGNLGATAEQSAAPAVRRTGGGTPSTWRERVQDVPPGCLVAVALAAAIWIIGWLILLVVGLSILG